MLRDYSAEVREALARGETGRARELLDEAIALAAEKSVRLRVRIREFEETGGGIFLARGSAPAGPDGDRAARDRD